MKWCSGCKQHKVASDFHRNSTTDDGLQPWCIECKRQIQREYRKTPNGRTAQSVAMDRWRQSNPEKVVAHRILNKAIRDGSVLRPERCTECASDLKVEGHHTDYSCPLDVVWLCRECHVAAHTST